MKVGIDFETQEISITIVEHKRDAMVPDKTTTVRMTPALARAVADQLVASAKSLETSCENCLLSNTKGAE